MQSEGTDSSAGIDSNSAMTQHAAPPATLNAHGSTLTNKPHELLVNTACASDGMSPPFTRGATDQSSSDKTVSAAAGITATSNLLGALTGHSALAGASGASTGIADDDWGTKSTIDGGMPGEHNTQSDVSGTLKDTLAGIDGEHHGKKPITDGDMSEKQDTEKSGRVNGKQRSPRVITASAEVTALSTLEGTA